MTAPRAAAAPATMLSPLATAPLLEVDAEGEAALDTAELAADADGEAADAAADEAALEVAGAMDEVSVIPMAAQPERAAASAWSRSLPVHEDSMHWVVEEIKELDVQRHWRSVCEHEPKSAEARQGIAQLG